MDLPTGKRVLGVLLGYWTGSTVHVTSSYALPYEQDLKQPEVFFIDHNYHEAMEELCKKVSAKEKPIGWYHSGSRLNAAADLHIHEQVFRRYCQHPVLVVISPDALPTAYMAVEEAREVMCVLFRTGQRRVSLLRTSRQQSKRKRPKK